MEIEGIWDFLLRGFVLSHQKDYATILINCAHAQFHGTGEDTF